MGIFDDGRSYQMEKAMRILLLLLIIIITLALLFTENKFTGTGPENGNSRDIFKNRRLRTDPILMWPTYIS